MMGTSPSKPKPATTARATRENGASKSRLTLFFRKVKLK